MAIRIGLGILLLALVLQTGPAWSLDYDESVSGDLANFEDPPILRFDLGLNTVRGTSALDLLDGSPANDADPFGIELPVGSAIGSVTFSYVVTVLTGSVIRFELLHLFSVISPDGTWTAGENTIAGAFARLYEAGALASTIGTPFIEWTFEYGFQVIPIPEPGSAILIGVGLAWLARPVRQEQARRRSGSGAMQNWHGGC